MAPRRYSLDLVVPPYIKLDILVDLQSTYIFLNLQKPLEKTTTFHIICRALKF